MYVHTYVHTYISTYIHMYIHTYILYTTCIYVLEEVMNISVQCVIAHELHILRTLLAGYIHNIQLKNFHDNL